MITVKPFKALRPAKDADKIASFPYDVISSTEARELAKGNPLSFLHVEKPEIDLPQTVHLYDKQVYEMGKKNLEDFVNKGILIEEEKPSMYLYSQTMDGRTQYGYVVAASTEDYGAGRIKKHEFTRKDKEEDRTRLISTMNATTGPVFLAYKDSSSLDAIILATAKETPLYDLVSEDGVRHTVWLISEEAKIKEIEADFAKLDALYIADGHHRAASAFNVSKERKAANANHTGQESYNFFLTVIFPADQLYIMDYNRVVKDLNSLSKEEFLDKLSNIFEVDETDETRIGGSISPPRKHDFGMYLDGKWYLLATHADFRGGSDPIKSLDVSILQDNVLGPILGINDPRTDKRIDFIGGIRGTKELEKYVDGGYAVAFSLYPTSMEDLMKVADAGQVMPPKSTWFEPKLRSGLLTYKY